MMGLILLISVMTARGADWPQFQGPNRNGISSETGLMKQWPDTGPEVLWTVEVGKGFGGVAIDKGKVYLLDRIVDKADVLRCFGLNTGTELWTYSFKAPGIFDARYAGSRSHPTVDDRHVYIMGVRGDLYCISKDTHQPVWNHNIVTDFGRKIPRWAMSQSPVRYKDLVIVAPIGPKAGMVAYKCDTGVLVWQSNPFEGDITYGSPMAASIDGTDQILIPTQTHIYGVDANTGAILWSTDDWQCRITVASPAYLGQGRFHLSGGYDGAGTRLYQVEKTADSFTCTTIFHTKECNGIIHQPVLYQGYIYGNGNDKGFRTGLICLDFQGNILWNTGKSKSFDWGGMLLADDRLYVIDGITGDLCMVKPDPSGYQEKGRFNLLSGKCIWGTLALSDGKLIARDQTYMKCVDVRGR